MNDIVSAPKVKPFGRWPRCFACGSRSFGLWPLRMLLMVGGGHYSRCQVQYCPGGKEPTEMHEHQHPLAGLAPFSPIKHEAHNDCAGIDRAHLHVSCIECRAYWLMECERPC